MGAIIESVDACSARRWPLPEGSIALAVRAARRSLARARREATDLDVLIHTGVFRDRHICEPAIAPFIQRSIGANPRLGRGERSTFSFDLTNGGCGFLNAIEIVDGLLRSGRARRGIVVTSDVDPTPKVSGGVSFAPTGGALLLRPGDPERGFAEFAHESFPKHSRLLRSGVVWVGDEVSRWSRSKHALVRDEDPGLLGESVKCATTAIQRYLRRLGRSLGEVDLVIPSQFPARFPRALREQSGAGERIVDASAEFGAAYTAGLPAALHAAVASGSWERAETILFVAVGAGIEVSLALYRRDRRAKDLSA